VVDEEDICPGVCGPPYGLGAGVDSESGLPDLPAAFDLYAVEGIVYSGKGVDLEKGPAEGVEFSDIHGQAV
jgi:hypothetical protein